MRDLNAKDPPENPTITRSGPGLRGRDRLPGRAIERFQGRERGRPLPAETRGYLLGLAEGA
jgi:hypothetical protein